MPVFALVLALISVTCGGMQPSGQAETVPTGYEIVAVYPHDPDAYTQGLFWDQGALYEGTGRYGTSRLRKVAIATGEVLQQVALPRNRFGEGIALVGGHIFQLTWQSNEGVVYEKDSFAPVGTFA